MVFSFDYLSYCLVFRMNQLIMEWPSGELYENKLKAAEMVKDHLLCHLEGVQDTENTQNALVFVDTAGFLLFSVVCLLTFAILECVVELCPTCIMATKTFLR